jgi:hypothetical protein
MTCRIFLAQATLTALLASGQNALAAVNPSQSGSNTFVKLPVSDTHYQRVKDYVEEVPDPDYHQAS